MTRAALALGLTLTLLATGARAQTPAPPPAVAGCEVTVESRTAGAIDIVPASRLKNATGPQIVWQPVGTGPSVILWVTFTPDSQMRMDNPDGVLIRFRTLGRRDADTLSVTVKARNGRAWRFDGKAITSDNPESAHIAFGLEWPYGRGLLNAIADSQPLTIAVEQDGATLNSESFALSNIAARDSLLIEARNKFQAASQAPCPARPRG